MIAKARKAQETVRNGGFAFGKLFSVCPLNWGAEESLGNECIKQVVDSCIHPLYEVENGVTTLNYDPEKRNKKVPVEEAFKLMGRAYAHLLKPENSDILAEIQATVDKRWERLKAKAENEIL